MGSIVSLRKELRYKSRKRSVPTRMGKSSLSCQSRMTNSQSTRTSQLNLLSSVSLYLSYAEDREKYGELRPQGVISANKDTVLGKAFEMGGREFPASPEDKRSIETWLEKEMPELMGSGKLKSNPILSRDGGLEGINEGLDFVKAGKVRLPSGNLMLPVSVAMDVLCLTPGQSHRTPQNRAQKLAYKLN